MYKKRPFRSKESLGCGTWPKPGPTPCASPASCDHDGAGDTTPSWTSCCPLCASVRESACAAHRWGARRGRRSPSCGTASGPLAAVHQHSCGDLPGGVVHDSDVASVLAHALTACPRCLPPEGVTDALGGLRAHRSHSFLLLGVYLKKKSLTTGCCLAK